MALTDDERAVLYRDQWDARIAYRANQLRAMQGDRDAVRALYASYKPVYDRTNYIDGQPYEDFMTVYDIDDDPSISASQVRLSGTTHAGEPTGERKVE